MTGEITLVHVSRLTQLSYKDDEVEETASNDLDIIALIILRQKLESKHKSILGINGSRIDTTLRRSGTDLSYVIRDDNTIDENDRVDIFEPTTKWEKLCTVEEHQKAYVRWCDTVCPK